MHTAVNLFFFHQNTLWFFFFQDSFNRVWKTAKRDVCLSFGTEALWYKLHSETIICGGTQNYLEYKAPFTPIVSVITWNGSRIHLNFNISVTASDNSSGNTPVWMTPVNGLFTYTETMGPFPGEGTCPRNGYSSHSGTEICPYGAV